MVCFQKSSQVRSASAAAQPLMPHAAVGNPPQASGASVALIVAAAGASDKMSEAAIRRRKRMLACPICKMLRRDGSAVKDGEVCNGGHLIINNVQKVWQCQQVLERPVAMRVS